MLYTYRIHLNNLDYNNALIMITEAIKKDNRAISPVVGVALLIAVIIVLSAVISVVVLDLASVDDEARAGVSFNEDTDEFTVTWVSEGNADKTYVKVNGSKVDGTTMNNVGDRVALNVNKDSDISIIGVTENNKHTLIRTTNAARDTLASGSNPVVSGGGPFSGVVSFNPPAEGVTITAFDSDGNQIDSATTNKKGEFTIKEADSYRLNGYNLNTEVEDGTEINISEGDVDTTDGTVEILMNKTNDGYYKVNYASDLYAVRYELGENYVLTRDIDMSHTDSWNNGDGFKPITEYEDRYTIKTNFTGEFDGNYHTISNMKLDRPTYNYIALFASVGSGGSVTNVSMVDVDVYGGYSEASLVGENYGLVENAEATGKVDGFGNRNGGLVGSNEGTINNSSASVTVSGTGSSGGLVANQQSSGVINNSYATGGVTGDYGVGGLAGDADGTIRNSHATGNVIIKKNGGRGGGFVGGLGYDATIHNSYSTGNVGGYSGAENISGFVGTTEGSSEITESYSTGYGSGSGSSDRGAVNVGAFVAYHRGTIEDSYTTGDAYGNVTGGFVGYNRGGTINNSYATGDVTGVTITSGFAGKNGASDYDGSAGNINNSYATGNLTDYSGSSKMAGLVGNNTNGDVKDLYWDTETTNQSEGIPGGSSKVTGLNTSEMTGNDAESNMSEFDFTNNWKTQPSDYPELRDD